MLYLLLQPLSADALACVSNKFARTVNQHLVIRRCSSKGQLQKSFSQFYARDAHCMPIVAVAMHELISDAAITSADDELTCNLPGR